jgi:hypothetical protein
MATPNQRLTADQFNNLQRDAPTVMEDRGLINGRDRLMILHLEAVVDQDDHADLDADFSHELDGGVPGDFLFEACGHCMDLGEKFMFDKMVADIQLPDDLKSDDK